MSKLLCEFEIVGAISTHGQARFSTSAFEACLREVSRSSISREAALRLQVVFDVEDFDSAERQGLEYASSIVEALSLLTSAKVECPRLYRTVDVSPGLTERRALTCTYIGDLGAPDLIDESIATSVGLVVETGLPASLARAVYWYREAMSAGQLDARFQSLWLSLETLVEGAREEKVVSKCFDQECRGDLHCSKCGKPAAHRPFAAEKIRLLLHRRLGDVSDSLFDRAQKARNRIAHGGTIVAKPGTGASTPVDLITELGAATSACLRSELARHLPAGSRISLWERNDYALRTFRVQSKYFVISPAGVIPDVFAIPEIKVTVVPVEGGYQVLHASPEGAPMPELDMTFSVRQSSSGGSDPTAPGAPEPSGSD